MSWLSRRSLGLLIALSVVLLAPSDCNIDVGNLGDFIVTHDITVTNSASEPALVWIGGSGIKRRSVVPAGGNVTATTYAGNSVLISVTPARDVLGELKAKRDAIVAKLNNKPLDLAGTMSIYSDLSVYNSAIRSYEQQGHGALCSEDLKVDEKGRGNDVSLVATFEDGSFRLAC